MSSSTIVQDLQNVTTIQQKHSFEVSQNLEKKITIIKNFGVICNLFKKDINLVAKHFAIALKTQYSVKNNMLFFVGLYSKEQLESTFKTTFSKKK